MLIFRFRLLQPVINSYKTSSLEAGCSCFSRCCAYVNYCQTENHYYLHAQIQFTDHDNIS